MSTNMDLHGKVSAVFSKYLHLEVPSAETDLIEAGVLDSLMFVELLLALEREFGAKISLDELDIDNFRSVAKIAELLANRNGSSVEMLSVLGDTASPGMEGILG